MTDFYEWMARGSGITFRHQLAGAAVCFLIALLAVAWQRLTAPKKPGAR